ncbi:TetR/AcrR family transcriptional regulator [Phytoactinopolyspora halotolerans]|uniref:TetR/AcrR family transcriptional regulator n=1 Tax=Phytoactinopolyspora halotolerans TaxID=1981512 RepID=A0A6L9SIS6_9ACTN|nr:TetR family transcriptional regulator [Phytoactinopolyspora halotolerans]NEE04312.1 TetR/AcrR family transcriptional regulator [Phytoactinopolyspora halotolerans]
MSRRTKAMEGAVGGRRPGRRPGRPDTRNQIIAAARLEFAEHGYEGTSMRRIASRAGVDPALMYHYFGAKERLLVASIEPPFDPEGIASAIAAAAPSERARRMAALYFGVWEDPAKRESILAMVRSAMTQQSAAELFRQFADVVMLSRVAPALRGPNSELRVEAAISHLFGISVARYLVKIEPMASAPVGELISLVAPVIQRYLDE